MVAILPLAVCLRERRGPAFAGIGWLKDGSNENAACGRESDSYGKNPALRRRHRSTPSGGFLDLHAHQAAEDEVRRATDLEQRFDVGIAVRAGRCGAAEAIVRGRAGMREERAVRVVDDQ